MSDLKNTSNQYTTGEIAKLCNVSVRTVQYYDTRGILIPSELSEGGRRLYSDDDLRKMKVICFLREMDISISVIGKILQEEDSNSVISLLLEQQEQNLQKELTEKKKQLEKLEELSRWLQQANDFSVESIGDIACIMENKKNLRKMRTVMLCVGIASEIVEVASIILWAVKGIWWPFIISLLITAGVALWMIPYYYKRTRYICPKCHTDFKPNKSQFFWATHTPTTRKLTCTHCGHKSYCVEIYDESLEK